MTLDKELSALLDHTGKSFRDVKDAASFLVHDAQVMGLEETVYAHTEQGRPGAFKKYVLLTQRGRSLRQLLMVETFPDRAPRIVRFPHPKTTAMEAHDEGATSRLILVGKERHEVDLLPPGDARRIMDLVRLGVFDLLEEPKPGPEAIAFGPIHAIEYYEALLGPHSMRILQTVHAGPRRFELCAVTQRDRGFFMVREFEGEGAHARPAQTGLPSFRENSTSLHRGDRKPYRFDILPAAKEPVDRLLARHHIAIRKNAPTILERYVTLHRISPLRLAQRILQDLGVPARTDGTGYHVAQGDRYDHLVVQGRIYSFKPKGDAVEVRPLHPRDPRGRNSP